MIHVIATIQVQEGRSEAFLRLLRELIPEVRAEAGCLGYEAALDVMTSIPMQPPVRPDTVTVVEKWRDVAALQAHLDAAHVAAFLTRARGMIRNLQLQVLEPA
jgi:quinol monooxygenase YgiN